MGTEEDLTLSMLSGTKITEHQILIISNDLYSCFQLICDLVTFHHHRGLNSCQMIANLIKIRLEVSVSLQLTLIGEKRKSNLGLIRLFDREKTLSLCHLLIE